MLQNAVILDFIPTWLKCARLNELESEKTNMKRKETERSCKKRRKQSAVGKHTREKPVKANIFKNSEFYKDSWAGRPFDALCIEFHFTFYFYLCWNFYGHACEFLNFVDGQKLLAQKISQSINFAKWDTSKKTFIQIYLCSFFSCN